MKRATRAGWAIGTVLALGALGLGQAMPAGGVGRAVTDEEAATLRGGACCLRWWQDTCVSGSGCGANTIYKLQGTGEYTAQGTDHSTGYCGGTSCALWTTQINATGCGGV